MKLTTLIHDVAVFIRNIDCLKTTTVIEEDLGNVETKLQNEVGQKSRCVLVGFGGSDPVKQGKGGPLIAKTRLVVSCFEKPVTNRRAGEEVPTALGMAQTIARELQGTRNEDMASCLFFRRITPLAELQGGVVSCDVVFDTDDTL